MFRCRQPQGWCKETSVRTRLHALQPILKSLRSSRLTSVYYNRACTLPHRCSEGQKLLREVAIFVFALLDSRVHIPPEHWGHECLGPGIAVGSMCTEQQS